MGVIARIPADIYREVRRIQKEYQMENGIEISFPKAMKLWEKRIRNKQKSIGRFPDFV